jgi:hypothetical protein
MAADRSRSLAPAERLATRWAWLGPTLLSCLLALLLTSCGEQTAEHGPPKSLHPDETSAESGAASDGVADLEWQDLTPGDWKPSSPFADADVAHLADDDPRARALMGQLRIELAAAPTVAALDDRLVRLSGFVLPLTAGTEEIKDFLLVPYFGACVHQPPPPANQTVHVTTAAGAAYRGEMFDTVWVEGRLHIEHYSNALGDAGYAINDARVRVYDQDP